MVEGERVFGAAVEVLGSAMIVRAVYRIDEMDESRLDVWRLCGRLINSNAE